MYKPTKIKSITEVEDLSFLMQLNSEELHSILIDFSKLEELVKGVKQYKEIEKQKELLLVSNRSLAEFNLNKEPILLTAKNQLLELNEICVNLYKAVEGKYSATTSSKSLNKFESRLSLVQMAAQEMEEESEALAESFLSGSNEIEYFLERFMQKRKLMHLRKIKADKMKEIMNEKLNIGRVNAYLPCPQVHPDPTLQPYRLHMYSAGAMNHPY
uniref:Putative vacuolar protein n=1 Tax=Triatoma dimidiata TaxID=72491 RepID=A0A0V0GDB2_TRIDM